MRRALLALTPVVSFAPAVALAAPRNFLELANYVAALISAATAVLIVLGLVVYFWGIAINITKMDKEKMKAFFFWGIIVLFFMVSVWGIVAIVQSTLFGDSFRATGQVPRSVFFPPPFAQ